MEGPVDLSNPYWEHEDMEIPWNRPLFVGILCIPKSNLIKMFASSKLFNAAAIAASALSLSCGHEEG